MMIICEEIKSMSFPTLRLKLVARLCILVCISELPDSMERVDSFAEHKVKLRNDLALTSSNQQVRNIFILFALLRCFVSLHAFKCLPTGFFFLPSFEFFVVSLSGAHSCFSVAKYAEYDKLKEVLLAGTRPDWTQGVLILQRKGGISLQE